MVFDHLKGEELNETVSKVIYNYNNDNDNDIHSIVNDTVSYRNNLPFYDPSKNTIMSKEEEEEILQIMKGTK